jgi:small GTP-binding protein
MMDDNSKIEQRLMNMKKFYTKADKLIDNLPDVIDESTKKMLKKSILGDQDLKNLMEGIDSHRPPRIFLIGRTGVGKSSLINALCGSYVARVSDTRSCTPNATICQCKDKGRVLMEILDTRGIAESESLNDSITAEDELIAEISEFSPDVAILMLNCVHRDDVNSDVDFLKKVAQKYKDINNMKLPIVVVVNKCDEMAPTRFKIPSEYPENKIAKINEVVQNYKGIIVRHGLKIDHIIAVSSLIDWETADGEEIGVEDIDNLPEHDIDNLVISFDGRYGIDKLLTILEESISDFEAQMGLRMAARLTEVVHRIAKQLTKVFSGISALIAVSPIPISDVYILTILQAILVSMIASLSGRDVSLDTAKEFILGMGGIAGAGYTFRLIAQQASKLLNVLWPGAGSAISSGIAALGTTAIGNAAVAYYIDNDPLKDVKKNYNKVVDKEMKKSKVLLHS